MFENHNKRQLLLNIKFSPGFYFVRDFICNFWVHFLQAPLNMRLINNRVFFLTHTFLESKIEGCYYFYSLILISFILSNISHALLSFCLSGMHCDLQLLSHWYQNSV